ncbi:unnamed protein product [Cercopithifilaria johnstoni]|uniref:Uncharacterized protein n=1 Tax=Cercopithifilaria johnstoni TaxID=2874296 RepID=A0A8J2M021_9BILA|nr:unnamed protein product [Cercopithifilaria johnstoni]
MNRSSGTYKINRKQTAAVLSRSTSSSSFASGIFVPPGTLDVNSDSESSFTNPCNPSSPHYQQRNNPRYFEIAAQK